jgi:hypothetical protein
VHRFLTLVATLLMLLALTGCRTNSALLYRHTIAPLDVNASGLELSGRSGSLSTRHWTYHVTVEWDGRGIGEIAAEHGFSRVDFADLEVLTILGAWAERTVHIYGTREQP